MQNDVIKLGNIYGFDGGSYDGNVFEENGLCPTLRACMCHGSVPEIIEIIRLDNNVQSNRNNTI